MNTFASVFIGAPHSRYAALAVLTALVAVSLTILFSKDTIPVSKKFGFVVMVFLVSLPSLAMSLFQLTCLVTGAEGRWWCSAYAWILTALVVFYSVILVIAAIMSLASPKESFEDKKKAVKFANMEHFEEEENKAKLVDMEHFEEQKKKEAAHHA